MKTADNILEVIESLGGSCLTRLDESDLNVIFSILFPVLQANRRCQLVCINLYLSLSFCDPSVLRSAM